MKTKLAKMYVVGALVAALLFAGISAVSAASDSGANPPWVRADGTVDPSRVPAEVPVLDLDGSLVRTCSGNLVTVPSAYHMTDAWVDTAPAESIVQFAPGDDPVYVPSLDHRVMAKACRR